MGLDHEQIEYYKKSKHGMIQEENTTSSRAPGCITCHMDEGTHDVSQGITIGTVSQGAFISDKSSGNDYVRDVNGIVMRSIIQEPPIPHAKLSQEIEMFINMVFYFRRSREKRVKIISK